MTKIAYFNEADPLQESWKILENDESKYRYKKLLSSPWVKFKTAPDPECHTGQMVYYPDVYGFRRVMIEEVEPLFASDTGEFIRYIYWTTGPGGHTFGKDFYLTKGEAIKASLRILLKSLKQSFNGKKTI